LQWLTLYFATGFGAFPFDTGMPAFGSDDDQFLSIDDTTHHPVSQFRELGSIVS
jgi:hypothetical protein